MPIQGYRDLSSLVNVGADAATLARYALADGVTYDRIVAELETVLTALNGEMARHPLWASLVSFQDAPNVSLRDTGATAYADRMGEYGRPEPMHAELAGHMLPLLEYGAAMGWTWGKLRKMSMPEAQADIRLAVGRIRNTYRQQIFRRLLRRGDDSGAVLNLGAGYSPGFATAAANTNLDYAPPAFGGVSFTTAHEHYDPAAGGWTTTIIDAMEADLLEHGITPPYRLLISVSDAATVGGLTGFVYPASAVSQPGSGTAVAVPDGDDTDDGFRFLGSYKNTRVYVAPGMPQHYGFMYKSYGSLSPDNPLRVRLEKGITTPTVRVLRQVTAGVQDANRGIDPLQDLMLYTEFGIGVGNRSNGVTAYVNNGNWADGTAV